LAFPLLLERLTPMERAVFLLREVVAWKPSGMAFRGMLVFMGSTAIREFSAWTGARHQRRSK
jgi:hypothetical protein